jgi:bifunctional UDP-N-acetylglucosamine pyrophosphorylase / glucosamine-1-phosphate N-acetyltransferase
MIDLSIIILGAGDGTRMKSTLPKLLHRVGGLPIISHVVEAAAGADAKGLAIVTAPGQDQLRAAVSAIAPKALFFEQTERRGTGHAAMAAEPFWKKAKGYVAIVYGDHPLLRPEIFKLVTDRLDAGKDAAILGFEPDDPTGYGRLITKGDRLLAIREQKDASPEELKIGLCNACILAFKADVFREAIGKLDNKNAQKEFYVTDLVAHANAAGHDVGFAVAPWVDVLGVNSREQLAEAEAHFQDRKRREFMAEGVTLIDPATVHFSYDTKIGRDVTVEPNVWFGPAVEIANNVTIHAFSHIEGAKVGKGVEVGPFARLRPGADLAENAKVGNFVEVKNAKIGKGAKLNHLSYIGDAEIGARTNIGAGTITCNYDGINKHKTVIGEGVFVGSNSSLVAPVTLGDGAYIASGSVVTENVPKDALAFGRARQENKKGYAPKLRAKADAFKAKKAKKRE